MDLQALSSLLQIGFLVFSDVPQDGQGGSRFLCSLDGVRGDYTFWILLYYQSECHFRLGEMAYDGNRVAVLHIDEIPKCIRDACAATNSDAPIGSMRRSGIS